MEHDAQGFFLHFECIKGPKVVFKKYVRALTHQTLGDIIENLIPERGMRGLACLGERSVRT